MESECKYCKPDSVMYKFLNVSITLATLNIQDEKGISFQFQRLLEIH